MCSRLNNVPIPDLTVSCSCEKNIRLSLNLQCLHTGKVARYCVVCEAYGGLG